MAVIAQPLEVRFVVRPALGQRNDMIPLSDRRYLASCLAHHAQRVRHCEPAIALLQPSPSDPFRLALSLLPLSLSRVLRACTLPPPDKFGAPWMRAGPRMSLRHPLTLPAKPLAASFPPRLPSRPWNTCSSCSSSQAIPTPEQSRPTSSPKCSAPKKPATPRHRP